MRISDWISDVCSSDLVEISRLEIIDQIALLDERIDEGDVVADAQIVRQRLQPVAIRLAFVRDEIGVGGAEHDVEQIGHLRDSGGQRLDHPLDALARREQPDGKHNLAATPTTTPPQTNGKPAMT